MKEEMAEIVGKFDVNNEEMEDFETKNNNRANYFMHSAWKIKPFFEEEARDD